MPGFCGRFLERGRVEDGKDRFCIKFGAAALQDCTCIDQAADNRAASDFCVSTEVGPRLGTLRIGKQIDPCACEMVGDLSQRLEGQGRLVLGLGQRLRGARHRTALVAQRRRRMYRPQVSATSA